MTKKPFGRPKKIEPCIWCEKQLGAMEMRIHLPICKSNPKNAKRAA